MKNSSRLSVMLIGSLPLYTLLKNCNYTIYIVHVTYLTESFLSIISTVDCGDIPKVLIIISVSAAYPVSVEVSVEVSV